MLYLFLYCPKTCENDTMLLVEKRNQTNEPYGLHSNHDFNLPTQQKHLSLQSCSIYLDAKQIQNNLCRFRIRETQLPIAKYIYGY